MHTVHQYVVFCTTQYETKTEHFKSELIHYTLKVRSYNILMNESRQYTPPDQIERLRS